MSDAASTTPHRERGIRARRQREAQRVHAVIAGVERKIPTYELLGEEGLARIEAAADLILEEVGMDFRGDKDALRLWREAGADVEGERVRFPVGLLRSILKTAPSAFVQHARNPERSLKIGGDTVVFAAAYSSPFVQDLAGGRRYGTLADFEAFVKLAYAIQVLGRLHRVEESRRIGDAGEHRVHAGGSPVRGEFHPAFRAGSRADSPWATRSS